MQSLVARLRNTALEVDWYCWPWRLTLDVYVREKSVRKEVYA